ncbi:MAG: sensor histidine kinase [Coprobacillaceae bacterium]
MNRKKVIILITISYVLVYSVVFAFAILGFDFFNIGENYNQTEQKYVEEIEEKLAIALRSDDTISDELQTLVDTYPIEVMARDEKGLVYSSVALSTDQSFQEVLNTNAITVESTGLVELENTELFVWYAIYHMPATNYFSQFLRQQNILIFIAFLVLLLLIIALQYYLLGPLYRVKDSIEKLENYEFEGIEEGKDELDKKVSAFSNKLNTTIHAVSRKNTDLELSLQREKERLHNTIQFSRALVHDLKSPTHQTLLENEYMIEKLQNPQKETIDISVYNINRMDRLLKNINEILKVMGEDVYQLKLEKETFNLVTLVQETIKMFKTSLWNKNLSFVLDTEEEIVIYENKIAMRLLIHNIISNMVQYSKDNSELELKLYKSVSHIIISSKNNSGLENIDRMKRSEQLFNVVVEEKSKEHVYSSGNGLFLIKDLTSVLDGEYYYTTSEESVILELRIPMKQESNNEE